MIADYSIGPLTAVCFIAVVLNESCSAEPVFVTSSLDMLLAPPDHYYITIRLLLDLFLALLLFINKLNEVVYCVLICPLSCIISR